MEPPTRDIPGPKMNGPSGVDDILKQLHSNKPGKRGINLGI